MTARECCVGSVHDPDAVACPGDVMYVDPRGQAGQIP